MKKLHVFFLFLCIGVSSFSQDGEQLTESPWLEILEMNIEPYSKIQKWSTDINVKLVGNYTKEDSLFIETILKKFDGVTETIEIKYATTEINNLKINFLDGTADNNSGKNYFFRHGDDDSIISGEIYIYRGESAKVEFNSTIESIIAKALVSGSYNSSNAKSVFNENPRLNNKNESLSFGDLAIIKEVYKKEYEANLVKAYSQFKNKVLSPNEKITITKGEADTWWVKNPMAVLFLPALILALLFVFSVKKIKESLAFKIKNEWFRFAVIAFVALLFFDVFFFLVKGFYDFIATPSFFYEFPSNRKDFLGIIHVTFVLIYPLLFLLRFIELKISKNAQQVFTKTVLIFLSTCIIPFIPFLGTLFINSFHSSLKNSTISELSQIFLVLMIIALLRALIAYFIFKERSIVIESEKQLSKLRELNAKAELKSLQSQINPHFLYNSLNSIASLAPIDAKKTQDMAHSLSDLFKYAINRSDKKMSTIKDEIKMVETYLNIEKIRFGDRLKFEVDIDKTVSEYEIPLFLIQPLVENAVKHGISKQVGKGKIALAIKKVDDKIVIWVSDSGPDFPEGLVSGHGLQTVYDLLRLSYGDKASLNWTNSPEKKITVTIPDTI
tara:strand:- start:32722 stop:34557 length:1836 start_codon:yes stop_codon:yes gene_type:complete